MAKKKNSKASSSSPRNTATTSSSTTSSSVAPVTATTTTTTTPATSSSTPKEHDTIKVTINEELIRQNVNAMMEAVGSATTATTTTPKWIGSIDQGTSSTRFMIFTTTTSAATATATAKSDDTVVVGMVQMEHTQIYTNPGWHEHDPIEIWKNVMTCISTCIKAIQNVLTPSQFEFLFSSSSSSSNHFLAAIGITNQRETIVCWNRKTGRPYYNAIVWDDARTTSIVNELLSYRIITKEQIQYITTTTGLPISTYFTTMKMKWLINHVEQIRYDIQNFNEQVCFGTIDTWIVYQLTGSIPKSATTGRPLKGNAGLCNIGGIYVTDVTNASRWNCMNLHTCQWDTSCLDILFHDTPVRQYINIQNNLPTIYPSSYLYGYINIHCGLPHILFGSSGNHTNNNNDNSNSSSNNSNIPIAAILGDQQAAMFGQAAYTRGCAKNTYGTGLFLMINTGPKIVPKPSTHGLLTTVAYQIGMNGDVYYAYEGSVSHSGSTIQWLRDQLGIIVTVSASEILAKTTTSNDGLYLVPAFSGLLAPHWKNDARGCIVGITALHHKGHLCRAALEATAYQTKDVFDAIVQDTKDDVGSIITLSSLNVDGGGTYNALLMQFQADMLNVPVVRPKVMETTSLGVAYAAGLTVGIYTNTEELSALWKPDIVYTPQMDSTTRNKYLKGWKKALTKSFDWITTDDDKDDDATTTIAEDTVMNTSNNLESSWTVVSPPTSSSSSPTTTDTVVAAAREVDIDDVATSTATTMQQNNTVITVNTPTLEDDTKHAIDIAATAAVKADVNDNMEKNLSKIIDLNEVPQEPATIALDVITDEDQDKKLTAGITTSDILPTSRITELSPTALPKSNNNNILSVLTTASVAFTAGVLVATTIMKRR